MSAEIGFSEVSEAHRSERRSKVLTKLPSGFYEEAEKHLTELREEYGKGGSGPQTMMLLDEIGKIEKRMKMIYEIRERKIALSALSHLGGAKVPENMTSRDRALFDELVDALGHYRSSGKPREPEKKAVIEVPEETEVIECQSQFVEKPTEEKAAPIIVHVLEDIPPFAGLDHTYELKKNDIVTLPGKFADLLSEKGMVRVVEG